MLHLLIVLLPLGLDTLSVSLGLGMKSVSTGDSVAPKKIPMWLGTALLFAGAEMIMPLVGLALGYELARLLSETVHLLGAVVLIGIGSWELAEEFWKKGNSQTRRAHIQVSDQQPAPVRLLRHEWLRHLFLAFSLSVDELVMGFSLGGAIVQAQSERPISLLIIVTLIGLQGCCMTLVGLALGRLFGARLKGLKRVNERLAALLLIGLGIWLLLYKG